MATLQSTEITDTGFLKLASGTTTQRPGYDGGSNSALTPVVGDYRFNTSINEVEYCAEVDSGNFTNSIWKRPSGGSVIATGGNSITDYGIYKRHVFTSTGNSTFSVTSAGYVDVLIVAGGGGAEDDAVDNGGGGGGGVVYRNRVLVGVGNYTITVGAGGAVGSGGRNGVGGFNGGNSSAFGFTALGGGGGAPYAASGSAGGSGGGSSEDNSSAVGGAATQPTATDVGYGNKGGDQPARNNNHGGGGGGAGDQGGPAYPITGFSGISPTYDTATDQVGNGGIGWYFGGVVGADLGENGYFAGGGGGGGISTSQGYGGLGGGGDGRTGAPGISPSAGQDGTGGGGGGSANNASNAGGSNGAGFRGGHGIVVIKYVR